MALTVAQCRNAKPGRHSDGRGLYLLVKPSGSRSWVLRVQSAIRSETARRDFGIGSFVAERVTRPDIPIERLATLTLAEAREKARLGRDLAKAGINPIEAWRQEETLIPSFANAAREYHKQVSTGWRNGKHGAQWLTTLEKYAFPSIGSMPVDSIDAPDLQRVLLPIWLAKSETAKRVRQRSLAVLDYAHGKNWRSIEAPARSLDKLMKGIKQPKASSFAAMPYGEVAAFWDRLCSTQVSVGRLALQFLILTAARSGEVRKARWSEMKLDDAEWHVPAAHTKTGRVHIVPLVPAAVALLAELKGLFEPVSKSFVFPGLKGMMSDATLAKQLRVNGGNAFTVHGFRSTFRDWAADTGFADAWAEAALAHGNPDKTEAAYKRTTYFQQRKDKLMPGWSSFLESGRSNVVHLVTASE